MGLIVQIKNIQSPNNFKLFYRTGRTPGSSSEQSSSTWGTQYTGGTSVSGVFSAGTTTITIDLMDPTYLIDSNPYGKQYWFKILDLVTGSYIIENIYIHDISFYTELCATPTPTPTPTATPDCTFTGGSAVTDAPTPTPTSTIVIDCTFTGGSALVGPTPTSTSVPPTPTIPPPTPTPTSTSVPPTPTVPPPTPTPIPPNTTWYFNHGVGTTCTASYLEIMKNGYQVVLSTITSGGASGTLDLSVGDQLLITVDTGNQSSPTGCSNAYVRYDSQQLVEDSQSGFNNAQINVTVTQNDINYGIIICGTIGGGICPV